MQWIRTSLCPGTIWSEFWQRAKSMKVAHSAAFIPLGAGSVKYCRTVTSVKGCWSHKMQCFGPGIPPTTFPELTAAPSFSAACVGNMWQPSHGAWVRGRHAEDRRRVAIRAAECHLAQGVLGLGPVSRWVPHPEAMMMHHVVKECKDMEHATLCLCLLMEPSISSMRCAGWALPIALMF